LEQAEETIGTLRADGHDSEALYQASRLLLQFIPYPAATVTRAGTILTCNLRFSALCGQSATFIGGKPLRNFISAPGRVALEQLLLRAWDGESQGDFAVQPAHGPTRPVLLKASPVREGLAPPCLLVVDVSGQREFDELQRALAELRASEERLTLAQRVGRIGSFEWNAEHGYIVWSATMEELYGLAPGAFEGSLEHWLALLHVDDRLRFEAECRRAFDQRGELDLEFRVPLPGDELRWLNCRGKVFQQDALRPRMVGVSQDITRRKRIEQQFQDADNKKDEFLATLAHELRNPLAPIGNALKVLRMGEARADDARRMYAMMERQLDHLVQLVDDLLEISRITRGRIELRRACIDVRDALRDAVEASGPLIADAGHELRLELPQAPLWVNADGVRIAQSVTNLLNNAARYTEHGGSIWLCARAVAGAARITVRDTGVGIASENLARIFEVFERGPSRAAQVDGGLGIGLTVVRMLVEMHGGSIVARSEGAGQGSEFIITLPLVSNDAEARPAREEAPPLALPRRRILVVDDNRDAADSLAMLLEMMGLEVRVAYDGRAALDLLANYGAEVVLLDIAMPEMDGIEVARRIRDQSAGRHVVLIAMTGWSEEELARRGARADFDLHLIKPVSGAVLLGTLATLPVPAV
ncbi:MAG: ATP-binding protein, partial [Gammaproteobacteria bacterium]